MGDRRNCPTGALATCILLLLTSASCYAGHTGPSHGEAHCSKKCLAEHCNSIRLRYGKYCGVRYTGCPGEKPCDELDACCKSHDECVEKKGMMSVPCHKELRACIKEVKKSGKAGFSKVCPYETAMTTMVHGMDMAIIFSSELGSQKGVDVHFDATEGSVNSPATPLHAATPPNGVHDDDGAAENSTPADDDAK